MTVNYATGEISDDLTREDAERLSIRIGARLDSIADNYTAVMPMIREALGRNAHIALGYRSPSEYASERFGDALSKLDPSMRREVVRELTEAGMSSRAIAPIVGISDRQIRRDQSGGTHVPPDSRSPESENDGETVTSSSHTATTGDSAAGRAGLRSEAGAPDHVEAPPRFTIAGIDGKTYTPPKPRALSEEEVYEREMDRGRQSTTLTVAESVYALANDPANFIQHFLPHEHRFVADPMRLSHGRIDAAIHFLTTVREAVTR